jgi:hypothetical protein
MKEIMYSKHAEERIKKRDLNKDLIDKTLEMPDKVVNGKDGTHIAHKDIGTHLLRVIFTDEGKYYLVITAYYTDKERYEVNG